MATCTAGAEGTGSIVQHTLTTVAPPVVSIELSVLLLLRPSLSILHFKII